jgi:hypothetical protein
VKISGKHFAASAAHDAQTDAEHSHSGLAGTERPAGPPPSSPHRGRFRRRRVVVLGCAVACALLACLLPAIASATTNYEMRGEWETIVGANHTSSTPGTCVINQMELTSGRFSGNCEFHGPITFSGTISGTVSGTTASVTIVIAAVDITYIAPSTTITTATKSLEGEGTYEKQGIAFETGPLTMTLTATYAEVQARELKEKEAREKAQELREKQEKEAKEKEAKEQETQELEARELKKRQETEAKEREPKEKEERELKERQEKEAREAAEKSALGKTASTGTGSTPAGGVATLVSAEPTTKTAAESRSGSISLELANPNAVAVAGHFTLTDLASAAKATGGKGKKSKKQKKRMVTLGGATFAISTHGTEIVKVKLSSSAATLLRSHKKIDVVLSLVTEASGAPSLTKTYNIVLGAARPAKGKS